jgi:hypothetical protein
MKMLRLLSIVALLALAPAAYACPTCGQNKPMPVDPNADEVTATEASRFNASILTMLGGVAALAGVVGVTIYGAAKSDGK